ERRGMRNVHLSRGRAVLAAFLLVGAATPRVTAAAPPGDSPDRIARVERGLLPSVRIHGEKLSGMDLHERMKRWKVPGVSIAVLDGESLAWARAYGVAEAGSTDLVKVVAQFQAGPVGKHVADTSHLTPLSSTRLVLDEDRD